MSLKNYKKCSRQIYLSLFSILFFNFRFIFFVSILFAKFIHISSIYKLYILLTFLFIKSKNTRRSRHEYASRSQRNRFLLGGYIQCNRIIEPVSPDQDFTAAVLENARPDIDDATVAAVPIIRPDLRALE